MKIQILIDNPGSWIVPYAQSFISSLSAQGKSCALIHNHNEVQKGDVLALLSCEKKFSQLNLNKYNLVVHESALPLGKGWSPLTWQILEGKNEIPVTLFEATSDFDAGPIYLQKHIKFEGHELLNEMKEKQAEVTFQLLNEFIKNVEIQGRPQTGTSSNYAKRTPADSELDINKSIKEQMNLLRVVDNERYPAYFTYKGQKYILKIEKN